METVFCPLCDMEIDGTTCMEISTHAEGLGPKECYPPGVDAARADKEAGTCLKCKYHPQ